MTVTYTAEVATCRGFGCFVKLLFRWKGSIYKLVWPDLMMFLFLYYALNLSYRFLMDEDQKLTFEHVVQYCETFNDLIPLSFVLGFYVSIVMTRWWDQYTTIPWPDPIAVFVSSNVHGQDERGRVMRRTIMRYACLCLSMVFTMISPRVKKRFPTLDHFVEAGLLTDNEKMIMTDLNEKFPRHSKHWLPIVWACSIVTRARKEGRVRDDFAVKTIIDEINKFRGKCGLLLSYDTISVPLVYTQVVTLACYSYFIACILSRQWLDVTELSNPLHKHRNSFDLYFPFFTTLQFFFYMGWLKVAESLINPFGEDDDDFEVNWLVDRNLQVSYLIVDEMHHEHPELIKDQYWDEVFPTQLPYTVASEAFREQHPQPSTANIEVPKAEAEQTVIVENKEDGDHLQFGEDALSGIHFSAGGSKRSISRLSTRDGVSRGSNSSINTNPVGSLASTIHRVGSVTSVLRRLFSREGAPNAPGSPGGMADGLNTTGEPLLSGGNRLSTSNSSASLHSKFVGGGSMRIADQVIEEVDEQATITSVRPPDTHPTVRTIFAGLSPTGGPPPPSAPVAVPSSLNPRQQDLTPLSFSAPAASATIPVPGSSPANSTNTFTENMSIRSAPVGIKDGNEPGSPVLEADTVSIGSSTGSEEDEFSRLKSLREKERNERYMQRLARSISAQQGALNPESDELLVDLTINSRTGLLPPSPHGGINEENV